MTWTTDPDSAQRARDLLDEGRKLTPLHKIALYGLTRSGASMSHRVLSAGYLNLYAQLLDTPGVESHS